MTKVSLCYLHTLMLNFRRGGILYLTSGDPWRSRQSLHWTFSGNVLCCSILSQFSMIFAVTWPWFRNKQPLWPHKAESVSPSHSATLWVGLYNHGNKETSVPSVPADISPRPPHPPIHDKKSLLQTGDFKILCKLMSTWMKYDTSITPALQLI